MREIVIRIRVPRAGLWTVVAALLFFGAIAYAAVPNMFNSGDPLSSAKVNANFSNLDGRVATLENVQAIVNVTPSNDWSNYDPGDSPLGYFKDPFGVVHLRGIVKEAALNHSVIMTLPAGFRPLKTLVLGVLCGTNGGNSVALGIAYVQPTGTLAADSTCQTTNYVSFESITFKAEQ